MVNWPLPVIWLIVALILGFRQKTFLGWRYWTLLALVSGMIVGMPFIFGFGSSKISISTWDGGNMVLVGSGKPTVVILGPSKDVLGDFYGQEIRKQLSEASRSIGSILVVYQPDETARHYLSDCSLYVISGGNETALFKWRLIFTPKFESKLLLINCRVPTDDWVKVFSRVVYCHGEFYGDPHYNEWKDFSAANPAVSVQDIPRHEAYIADWWSLLGEASSK